MHVMVTLEATGQSVYAQDEELSFLPAKTAAPVAPAPSMSSSIPLRERRAGAGLRAGSARCRGGV